MADFTEITDEVVLTIKFTSDSSEYCSNRLSYAAAVKRLEDSSINKTFNSIDNVTLITDVDFLTVSTHTIDKTHLYGAGIGDLYPVLQDKPYVLYDILIEANTDLVERTANIYAIWNNIQSTNYIKVILEPHYEYEPVFVRVNMITTTYAPYCPGIQLFTNPSLTEDTLVSVSLNISIKRKDANLYYLKVNGTFVDVDTDDTDIFLITSTKKYGTDSVEGHLSSFNLIIKADPTNSRREGTIYAYWNGIRSQCGVLIIIEPNEDLYTYIPVFLKLV